MLKCLMLIIAKSISSNKIFGFKDPKNSSQTESEDIKHAEVVGYSNDLSIRKWLMFQFRLELRTLIF